MSLGKGMEKIGKTVWMGRAPDTLFSIPDGLLACSPIQGQSRKDAPGANLQNAELERPGLSLGLKDPQINTWGPLFLLCSIVSDWLPL